jgi:aryl-alcohol dehydrogenase-like predicted oxidoreductase
MTALDDVVRSGKTRYIGASSMLAWQLLKAQYVATLRASSRFVSVQPHYNLLNREEEREMLPMCQSEGIGVVPWSPLARGRLARPWGAESTSNRVTFDRTAELLYSRTAAVDRHVVDAVGNAADRLGISRAQVSLSWLLSKPSVTAPIIGAGKISHLEDALGALDVELDDETTRSLEAPYTPHAASFNRELPCGNQDS